MCVCVCVCCCCVCYVVVCMFFFLSCVLCCVVCVCVSCAVCCVCVCVCVAGSFADVGTTTHFTLFYSHCAHLFSRAHTHAHKMPHIHIYVRAHARTIFHYFTHTHTFSPPPLPQEKTHSSVRVRKRHNNAQCVYLFCGGRFFLLVFCCFYQVAESRRAHVCVCPYTTIERGNMLCICLYKHTNIVHIESPPKKSGGLCPPHRRQVSS